MYNNDMELIGQLDKMTAVEAAPRLLGARLVREFEGEVLSARIVETEAYHELDPAAHSFGGQRGRNEVMFGPSGRLYVYFTYGMHYCANVVVGPACTGEAVLIRAVEPLSGIEAMLRNRPVDNHTQLTNGPAKWCQAFVIDKSLNGHDLRKSPLRLEADKTIDPKDIVTTTRIGISKAVDEPLRFYIRANPWVSKS